MARAPGIEVSVLIISYNTRELTLNAISSAADETTGTTCEIIVVDNGSSDGSAEAIAAHPARPRLIALAENIGFARANNLAAETAAGDYILLLNPDTVVRDGAIDRLVAFARENRRALVWGGRTIFADGRLNPSSCWRRITLWNLLCRASGLTGLFPHSPIFNSEAYGGWQRDTVREVDIVSGCFLLIPRPIWLALGGFDAAYFMYGEDADLCLRAKRLGARPLVTPAATIVHHGGASEATRPGKMVKLLAAKATLIARHWPEPFDLLGRLLLMMWPLSRTLALGAAARMTGSAGLGQSARVWREIWERRGEWQFGYSRPELIAEERAAQVPILPPAARFQ